MSARATTIDEVTFKPFVVPGTLLFSLVLIRAPLLLGASSLVTALSVAPFVIAIMSLVLFHHPRWYVNRWILAAAAYVALLVVATGRAAQFGALSNGGALRGVTQIMLLALLCAFAFLREPRAQERERYLRALVWAPVVYVAVNVALHFVGFVGTQAGYRCEGCQLPAATLQALGVPAIRVQFPLAPGVNAFGPICAIALATSATFVLRREQTKFAILGALISLYAILAIDSRGALLFAVLAVAFVHFTPRARKRGLGWIAIALPVLPILLIATIGALSSSAAVGGLSRVGSDITTGTGRTVVWTAAADTLIEPRFDNLFGYGQNGQLTSGASLGYAYLFSGQVDPLLASAHNMLLQTGLDLGWVGIPCVVLLACVMLARFGRRLDEPLYLALLAGTLAVLLVGIVESAATTASPESFIWWLMAIFPAMRAASA